jgi:hypothetical protein
VEANPGATQHAPAVPGCFLRRPPTKLADAAPAQPPAMAAVRGSGADSFGQTALYERASYRGRLSAVEELVGLPAGSGGRAGLGRRDRDVYRLGAQRRRAY